MMKKLITIILTCLACTFGFNLSFASFFGLFPDEPDPIVEPIANQIASPIRMPMSEFVSEKTRKIKAQAPHLNTDALRFGLKAYYRARQMGLDNKQLLTIIDYSAASITPRLYVVNLNNDRVEYNTLVAHGAGSGDYQHAWRFSNYMGSGASSLGVFLTGAIYRGHNGPTMILDGLERGVNSNARARHIVMHGAQYVNNNLAYYRGILGRSSGCPALTPAAAQQVINRIKGGTILFAYYPDNHWINHSRFLA